MVVPYIINIIHTNKNTKQALNAIIDCEIDCDLIKLNMLRNSHTILSLEPLDDWTLCSTYHIDDNGLSIGPVTKSQAFSHMWRAVKNIGTHICIFGLRFLKSMSALQHIRISQRENALNNPELIFFLYIYISSLPCFNDSKMIQQLSKHSLSGRTKQFRMIFQI